MPPELGFMASLACGFGMLVGILAIFMLCIFGAVQLNIRPELGAFAAMTHRLRAFIPSTQVAQRHPWFR